MLDKGLGEEQWWISGTAVAADDVGLASALKTYSFYNIYCSQFVQLSNSQETGESQGEENMHVAASAWLGTSHDNKQGQMNCLRNACTRGGVCVCAPRYRCKVVYSV